MAPIHKHLCLSFLLLIALNALQSAVSSEKSMTERHERWMSEHGRRYEDAEEKEHRYKIFKANVEFIESFNNNGTASHRLGINEFADMANEEFVARRNGYRRPVVVEETEKDTVVPFRYEKAATLPWRVNWKKRGAVSPVKNQEMCGCCSIFSGLAAVEGLIKIKKNVLVSLSEQELVDCDRVGQDRGCNGGTLSGAFEYISRAGGVTPESEYPFRGVEGACQASRFKASPSSYGLRGFESVPKFNEYALLKAVAHQPVSVVLDGEGQHFQFYSHGILSNNCGDKITHAITIVGYGVSRKGRKFWIAKNSWGEKWGEKGFVRLVRGVNQKEGICGIYTAPIYPVM